MIDEIISKHDLIITMEEGIVSGGFGSSIIDYINDIKNDISIIKLGIKDEFIEHATRIELLDMVGLNKKTILKTINDYYEVD